MKYVNLGRSGLKVSRLCLGCMSYGEPERLPQPWSLDEQLNQTGRPWWRLTVLRDEACF